MVDFEHLQGQGLSFLKYRKLATPVRIGLSVIIAIHFFGLYQLPPQVLYPSAILAIGNLLSIVVEKAKLATVEIADRKCPKCHISMYSKMIKCEKCSIQIDTDDESKN